MKRRAFTVFSLSFLCLMFSIQVSLAQSISEGSKLNPETAIKDIDITKLLPFFYQLWKDSAFRNDPNRTERAAWIIRKSDGAIEFVRWPRSGAWAREVWVGPPPKNIVAQAHTHPAKRDPKPSSGDQSLSKRTNVPIYTISANGVWRITTDGKMTKLTGNDWNKPLAGGTPAARNAGKMPALHIYCNL